ncbi:MAG: S-layer homology domain-containing protein [Oscillospiraceae bacterium]
MPTGTLTVTKTVSGLDNGVSLPNNFAITVKQGDTVVATKGLTDATGSGTDASPYSWTINNLTPGTYTVEESNYAVAGYSVTATPVYDPDSSVDGDEVPGKTTATVTAGGTATAALTNTYTKQYTLTVKYYYDSVDASNEFTPVGVTTFSYTLNKGASWNIIVGTPGAGETCTHNAPESVTRTVNGSEVNYVFDSVASDALEGTITGDVTVNLVYSKDEIGEGEDLNQPDGIPDKYQVTVKYISSDENMGAVTGTTEVLTIKDTSGKYLTTGTVKISGSVASATSGYAFTEWTAKSSDATEMVSFAVDENDAKILTSEQEISVTGGRVYTFTANFEGYPVVSVDKTLKTTVPENGFKIGNVVEWEIKVSNSGTEKATGLSLSDTLTIGSRTVSLTPTAEGLNASNFEVAAKSEVTFIAQYTVIKDDLGETLNNKAVVTVTEGNKPEDSDNTGKVENPYSKLGVTKTRTTAAEVQVGDTIEWTITISNSGNTDANKVTIADTLNNGANAVITLDGNTVTEVNVPAGGTVTLEASYLVVEADAGKTLTNAVTVSNPADPDDKASDTDEGTKVAARYTVTTSIDKHGEITPTTTYNAGEDAEVYFTVDQNYAIKSVTVDGIETKDYSWDRTKSAYVITFPSIDNDHNVVVTTTYNGYIPPVVNDPTIKVKGLNTVDHVAYIIGVGNDEVNPLGTITRAEIANIYFRLMTDEFRSANWGTDNRFKDVPDDAWYTMAVLTLDKAGIITDSDDGNFRPNDPITRAELAVMAAQFCTVTGKIPATSFKDVPSTHWAAKEIALIEYAGWIEGYAGYFRPDDNLTRAEAVTIVNRMLQRGAEEENMLPDMVTFVDNADPDMWYYEAIQEAANAHDYTRTTKLLTGETFRGEKWTALLEATDWAALEQAWIAANSK